MFTEIGVASEKTKRTQGFLALVGGGHEFCTPPAATKVDNWIAPTTKEHAFVGFWQCIFVPMWAWQKNITMSVDIESPPKKWHHGSLSTDWSPIWRKRNSKSKMIDATGAWHWPQTMPGEKVTTIPLYAKYRLEILVVKKTSGIQFVEYDRESPGAQKRLVWDVGIWRTSRSAEELRQRRGRRPIPKRERGQVTDLKNDRIDALPDRPCIRGLLPHNRSCYCWRVRHHSFQDSRVNPLR